MQTGLFAIEAQVLNLKSTAVPQGPLIVTLRIGKTLFSQAELTLPLLFRIQTTAATST